MDKTRAFEDYGIYISIVFAQNLNREPAWRFIIDSIEDQKYKSRRFYNRNKCEMEALKKAVEYLDQI